MVWKSNNSVNDQEIHGSNSSGYGIKKFVTISRDPGSGGKPIAKMLANKLGYKFYDQALIDQIAKSVHARKEILAQIDEKDRSRIEDLIHSILNPEYISERRYIKHLCKVVLSLAHEKNAIFLGRGTNFILPRQNGLNVRITAPYGICVARAIKYEGVNRSKAREIIQEVTTERAAFIKQYFGKDINNPKYYDITLNTASFNLEESVEILATGLKKKFTK
jgi:cytidylate kinase